MYNSNSSIVLLLCAAITSGHLNIKLVGRPQHMGIYFYKELLMDIKTQQTYDSILVVQHRMPQDPRLQMIYSLPEPKVIITNQTNFYYKGQFNNEIIAVVIIERQFSSAFWDHFLNALDYMRQTRIVMISVNIFNTEKLQLQILKACEEYKITNGLLHFLNSSILEAPRHEFLQLFPYPQYHLNLMKFGRVKEEYFPKHWQNMRGKVLLTLPDQIVPRSMMYKDKKGEIQFSGFVAKLVLLFAEVFNATLKMPFQPTIDEILNFNTIFNMTKHGELNLPMSISPFLSGSSLRHMSYPTEVSEWMTMIPCATRIKVSQIYRVMLKPHLWSIILVFTATFSLIHTVIEKLFYNQMIWQNIFMSDKVIPGVLGQSFTLKRSSLLSLRLIYVLIFILGLYISTLFSAHLQTLITKPPYEDQISTFEELILSDQQILLSSWDVANMDESDFILSERMKGSIVITDNASLFGKLRDDFNSTYGYTVPSALWSIYTQIQLHYANKRFCVSEHMNIRNVVLFGLPLGEHSPIKEPLDYLVHKIHSSGLLHAWQMHVFNDLLHLKKISFRDSSRFKTYEDLTSNDLLLVWIILAIGLISSLLIFFVELMVNYFQLQTK